MESVQKFILSTTIFLLFIIAGTMGAHTETIENETIEKNTSSTAFYQQQETPFEKTIHFLYMNGIADLSQALYSSEISASVSNKPLSDPNNLYNTTVIHTVAGLDRQYAFSFTGIEYYIYTLRRILI